MSRLSQKSPLKMDEKEKLQMKESGSEVGLRESGVELDSTTGLQLLENKPREKSCNVSLTVAGPSTRFC